MDPAGEALGRALMLYYGLFLLKITVGVIAIGYLIYKRKAIWGFIKRYPKTFISVAISAVVGYAGVKAYEINAYESSYVDFKRFAEDRPCAQVRFMCLPESQDKSWQSLPTKDRIEDFELTTEVMERYRNYIEALNNAKTKEERMRLSDLNRDFYDRVNEKRFIVEMEQELEKEFPGFWRDVPKKVRYRWIRRAMNKAKRFGYDPKLNNGIVELCARIGLDFDKDPKWDYITKFISAKEVHLLIACDYIDWTIFGKTHGYSGVPITDWSMRRAKGHLPAPKKPYPKLND